MGYVVISNSLINCLRVCFYRSSRNGSQRMIKVLPNFRLRTFMLNASSSFVCSSFFCGLSRLSTTSNLNSCLLSLYINGETLKTSFFLAKSRCSINHEAFSYAFCPLLILLFCAASLRNVGDHGSPNLSIPCGS